jgi:hypothetical protein
MKSSKLVRSKTKEGKESTSQPKLRLITDFDNYDLKTLTDWLSFMAVEIENAMIQSGAEPGKDYTYLDIFKLVIESHAADRIANAITKKES